MKLVHKVLIAVAVYEVSAFVWNFWAAGAVGSAVVAPLDGIGLVFNQQ
jgi:hypothetical protein